MKKITLGIFYVSDYVNISNTNKFKCTIFETIQRKRSWQNIVKQIDK